MIKLILFDLDDTLCDYSGAKESALKKLTTILEDKLIDSSGFWKIYREKEPVLFRKFVSQEISVSEYRRRRYKDVLQEMGYSNEDINDFADKLNDEYIRITNDEVVLFKETDETLKNLRNRGYKLAILTNGPLDGQMKKINKFNLENKVDKIYYSAEIGVGKPSIEAFKYVINDMNIKASEIVMIGDSVRDDYNGALNADIKAVLIERRPEKWKENFEGTRISSLKDISRLLHLL